MYTHMHVTTTDDKNEVTNLKENKGRVNGRVFREEREG